MPTPRVERLRAFYQGLRPVLRIDQDRIMARVMGETDGRPMILRRAKAFAAVVREVPIEILPDENFNVYTCCELRPWQCMQFVERDGCSV